jgi:transcriptional regulator with AAA-type ATPase domain/tetratricopeptide (TPR) repeat protein
MPGMKALADLIGDSPGLRSVRETIARLLMRQTDTRRLPSILIQGETGTGKSLLARMIHRAGSRPDGPFIDVNCAAIPDTLLEAEMFGFERGAFTDARRSKPGLFQAAHHGTIFLDEVGLLPEALQAKLLKVLEDRTVRRLGATRDEPIDVWVLTATNEDLRVAIRERRFREDLYHRLAVLTVALPPLRERGGDILALAEHFLARVCAEYGVPRKALAPDARRALGAYPWPGNVRELSNVLERAVLMSSSAEVTAEALALDDAKGPAPAPAAERAAAPVSLADAMRAHLVEALTQTDWNISRTAALLGISRNTLRARMDKYGLRGGEGAPKAAPAKRATGGGVRPSPPPASVSGPPAAPPVGAASLARRWERRRVALLRVALIPLGGPDASLDTARALEVVVEKTRTFGGHVEGIGPIGIVAAFGLDAAGDAADRAAHAALAIAKAAERARREAASEVRVRVGLHATPVLVGLGAGHVELDMDERRDLWPLLDELIELAPLDGISVTSATAALLTRRFELAPGRGAAGGAPTQVLVGRERTGLGPGGRMATFVGRQHELELLESCLASLARGHGQVVGIGGEAGIGKSRLIFEFQQLLTGRNADYLEAHCLSYGSTVPYLPVLDVVRWLAQVTEADTPEVTAQKVRGALDDLGLDGAGLGPYLLHLLGVKEGADAVDVSHGALKTRIFEILRQALRRRSRQRPIVLVVEDLHWIDATSEEFFGSVVDGLTGAPIFVICTYRPGYRPPWIEKSYATLVALQPLEVAQARRVVRSVLGDSRVPESLIDVILAKAEGNAFFLEELARAVREPRDPAAPIVVPDTVQDVLLARLDRLPPAERALLASAAVIGKDFSLWVVQSISGLTPDAVSRSLAQLEAGEFIHETGGGDDPEYTFRHALTHEVVYASVGEAERRRLHARILDALERLYADRISERIEDLARHATAGGVWAKALAYLRPAGAKAYAGGAHREAVARFEQALGALAQLPPDHDRLVQAVELRFELRTSLLPLGEVARGLEYIREAEPLVTELNDPRRLGQLTVYLIGQLYLMGEHDRAWEAGQRALAIADTVDDFALRVSTNTYVGQVLHARGEYGRAAGFFRSNVAALVGERARERFGLPQLPSVHSRTCLVWSLAELGQFEEALARAAEAAAIAESADQPLSRTVADAGLGVVHLRQGQYDLAIGALERGLGLIREWSIPLWFPRVASALGVACAFGGRAAEGLVLLERAVEQATTMRLAGGLSLLVGYQAQACLLAGRLDDAEVHTGRALALARGHGERGYEAMGLRLLGEVALRRGDAAAAETALEGARTLGERLAMRPLLGHCHVGLARARRRRGDLDGAAGHLAAAREVFTALDMRACAARSDDELLESG